MNTSDLYSDLKELSTEADVVDSLFHWDLLSSTFGLSLIDSSDSKFYKFRARLADTAGPFRILTILVPYSTACTRKAQIKWNCKDVVSLKIYKGSLRSRYEKVVRSLADFFEEQDVVAFKGNHTP